MIRTFKVLSALLSYPTAEAQAAAGDLRVALAAEALLAPLVQAKVDLLIDEIGTGDLLDRQERYVQTFDQGRSLSLHLFEHVHGESRDRGQAMVDLQSLYEANGLTIADSELPDYLPLVLEFISTRPLDFGRELLGQTAHILSALGQRLAKRDSPYAAVFDALMDLAVLTLGQEHLGTVREEGTAEAADPLALDAAWEDAPVSFSSAAVGCDESFAPDKAQGFDGDVRSR